MATPNSLVITGYGINCDEETAFALDTALRTSCAKSRIVHINDIIDGHVVLSDYQILVFPGGFSYGDDTGSGKALASRIRNNIWDEMQRFAQDDHLILGICNGFQVLVNLGLLPALDRHYVPQVALVHNDSARYKDRWVDLELMGNSPWVDSMNRRLSMPIAHGEGRFYAEPDVLNRLKAEGQIALKYIDGIVCGYLGLPANPNGSLEDIAGITDPSGRILGMMPHPERAIDMTQLPQWTQTRESYQRRGWFMPKYGPGLLIFQNCVKYFK